jgi:hypothetical protein
MPVVAGLLQPARGRRGGGGDRVEHDGRVLVLEGAALAQAVGAEMM